MAAGWLRVSNQIHVRSQHGQKVALTFDDSLLLIFVVPPLCKAKTNGKSAHNPGKKRVERRAFRDGVVADHEHDYSDKRRMIVGILLDSYNSPHAEREERCSVLQEDFHSRLEFMFHEGCLCFRPPICYEFARRGC